MESRETGLHERRIQTAHGGVVSRLHHRTADIYMPSQHGLLERAAQRVFERIQIRCKVKMRVQALVIDTLERHRDFALWRGALDAGEPRHAANGSAHGFTSGSGSRYCNSCNRW